MSGTSANKGARTSTGESEFNAQVRERWEEFRREVIGPRIPDEALAPIEVAFFAGASTALNLSARTLEDWRSEVNEGMLRGTYFAANEHETSTGKIDATG